MAEGPEHRGAAEDDGGRALPKEAGSDDRTLPRPGIGPVALAEEGDDVLREDLGEGLFLLISRRRLHAPAGMSQEGHEHRRHAMRDQVVEAARQQALLERGIAVQDERNGKPPIAVVIAEGNVDLE